MQHEVPEMEMIIIKRGHPHEEHPHGGAWKVAFADFMTAMMAFFLVLWIVNSTNKETRSSVARYFNPIRISDTTAARKGLKDPHEADFDASAGNEEKTQKSQTPATSKSEGQTGPLSGNGGQNAHESSEGAASSGSMDPITARDPFIVLDELAGRATGASAAEGRAASAEFDMMYDGPTPYRDPFAPPAPVLPPEAKPATRPVAKVTTPAQPVRGAARPSSQAEVAANERANADANSVAERLREETEKAPRPINNAATAAAEKQDAQEKQDKQEKQDGKAGPAQMAVAEATNLREGIARVLHEVGLSQGPKLDVRVVDDGILISLTDDMSFGMFSVGSAEPQPRVVRAMEKIGALLAPQPGSFIIRGHTDARAYKSRAYDNWRLSAARAQMAAYMLMRGKLDEKRIERIEGHADRALRNTADPLAAENRRIEILLRRTK